MRTLRGKVHQVTEFELKILRWVLEIVNPKKVYCEIGSLRGGSLHELGHQMDDGAYLLSVDLPREGCEGAREELIRTANELMEEGYQVHTIRGNSRSDATLSIVKETLGGRAIDVLLIDGDHSLYGVASDVEHYAPMVRKGGIVIFHDCGMIRSTLEEHKNVKTSAYETLNTVSSVYRAFAFGKKQVFVQEAWGLGVIWV